jgi:predicted TIM-barrel fold metal-dependent hydrolase
VVPTVDGRGEDEPGESLSVAVRDAVPEGLVDLHTHFLPDRVLRKVWAYFDQAERHYGVAWPVRYRLPEDERVRTLARLGVTTFAPLVYAHRPGMAAWLNDWVADFAARTPGAVPTATFFAEPAAEGYLAEALGRGARVAKVHVQVGGFDPRDDVLDPSWGLLAETGVPVVVHCGDGPIRGAHTGLGVFEEVLRRHPRLVAVLAHAGMPDYLGALALVARYPRVHLDTTMVGTAFTESLAPLPPDWAARLADVVDRVVLGSDFPNIPYPYAEQLDVIERWSDAPGLGRPFLRAVLRENGLRLLSATERNEKIQSVTTVAKDSQQGSVPS